MKLLRSAWKTGLWCTRKGCLMALWSLWLLMIATACLEFYVIRAHELSLPGPIHRLIERRLAEKGFEVTFGRATFDFSGRILLEHVALGPTSTPTPLITARSVYVKLDPWELVIRRLDVESLSASGVDFHLPAMMSPSGEDETLVNNVAFTLVPRGHLLQIDHLTGRIADLSVSVNGSLRLPVSHETETTSSEFIDGLVSSYLRSGRQAPALIARLAALEAPTLDIDLIPADNRIAIVRATLRADSLNLASIPEFKGAATGALTLNAEMPLGGNSSSMVRGDGLIASLNVPDIAAVKNLHFNLLGLLRGADGPFALKWLDLQFSSVRARDVAGGPASVTIIPRKDGLLAVDLSAMLADSPWQAGALLDFKQSAGRVELDGRVDGALLGLAGGFAKRDLASLLVPAVPAPLHASATFLPGWKLEQAEGRLHSGPVLVGGVPLDETGTEFTYRDGRVLCDNFVLRQGESLAHGLYEMDTATFDFRFLLTGGLRPNGIAGWFHGWWTRFWNDFDFSKSVPVADVDVSGRWGSLTATRVFVQAEGAATGLRGAAFDRVSTRLFVRPQWDDILYFKVAQGAQQAEGTFSRLGDLEKNAWSRMVFSVDSSLPLGTMERLFGKDASELFTPYRFANAPRLKLSGHVESPASPGGAHQEIAIVLGSTGASSFHNFPLADLAFTARYHDGNLDLPSLAVVFADGRANGSAKVWGDGKDRRVSFDFSLAKANLGAAILALNVTPEAKPKPGENTLSQRLESGRLNLTLNAQGPYADFYGFTGKGTAEITGADLGQINLFGVLSELLKKTVILNFSSFSLDRLDAEFDVDGPRVKFGSLKISGPTAAIDAKGDYGLQDHRLDFKAKIFPFDENKSIVLSPIKLVLSPFSNALEVKLQGTLAKPEWIFAYGPTSLLRSIIGGPTPQPDSTNP
ncbi:MAG: AsmA-like C-terminal region-containing protein [Opitutaceae bacterium]|jgi:hypothetical protein